LPSQRFWAWKVAVPLPLLRRFALEKADAFARTSVRSIEQIMRDVALHDLIQRWVARAEFNTSDRGLTVEIRTVPASAIPLLFETEGDPSATKTSRGPDRRSPGHRAPAVRMNQSTGRRKTGTKATGPALQGTPLHPSVRTLPRGAYATRLLQHRMSEVEIMPRHATSTSYGGKQGNVPKGSDQARPGHGRPSKYIRDRAAWSWEQRIPILERIADGKDAQAAIAVMRELRAVGFADRHEHTGVDAGPFQVCSSADGGWSLKFLVRKVCGKV
jgi:hypothetical protein